MPRPVHLALAIAATLTLFGCPPGGDTKAEKKPTPSVPTACAKVGDPCEYSPGKLGSCVQRDECATPPCMVCQSQH